jgi:dihydrofolate reductase
MSRLVTYGAACSLDGFIARPDGAVDWLHFSKDVQEILRDYWAGIDTVLMGRKTWEVAAASAGGGSPYLPMKSYVFSRTLEPGSVKGAEIVADDAGGFVRALKEQVGKNICVMGGGELARSLFAAGVIDEVGLNVHPVLLGSGVPLFLDPGHQVDLELVSCREIEGGCVMLTYRSRPPRAKTKRARGKKPARA